MQKRHVLILLVITTIFSSCATFFSGSHDYISFASYPQGALLKVNGKEVGVTPLTINRKRSILPQKATLELAGYRKETFHLKKKFNFLSLINGPNPVTLGIDAISGAMLFYRPHFYEITLKDENGKPTEKEPLYNMTDNFFVKTPENTIYCKPLLRKVGMFGNFRFETLDGKKIKEKDVPSFKAIKVVGYGVVTFKAYARYYECVYERHPLNEKKPKKNIVYMEVLLKNDNYRLLMHDRQDFIYVGNTFGVTGPEWGRYKYFLYKDDELVEEIDRGNYEKDLPYYFSNYSDIANNDFNYRSLRKLYQHHKIAY